MRKSLVLVLALVFLAFPASASDVGEIGGGILDGLLDWWEMTLEVVGEAIDGILGGGEEAAGEGEFGGGPPDDPDQELPPYWVPGG